MEVTIVPMRQEHTAQIAALEATCFSDPWPESILQKELENPLSLWLCAPAAALYASLGFAQIGLRKNYYQHPKEDARILRKELL